MNIANEPSAANKGNLIFYAGNHYAARSTDGGSTWEFVDPSADMADFCCDQDVIFEPSRAIFVWYRQGLNDTTGVNRVHVSVSADLDSWWQYDLKPTDVDGTWANEWFDFPQLAHSNNYLYISTNMFNRIGLFQRAIIMAWPLDALQAGEAFQFSHYATGLGSIAPVQGTSSVMYWATHESTSTIRIWTWPENAESASFVTRSVPSWTWIRGSESCPGPDNRNFCGRADSKILSGWLGAGRIGFFWNAGAGGSFPYPYVEGATFQESDLTYVAQLQIWNPDFAWLYPYASANLRGELAVILFFGGGNAYPSVALLVDHDIADDVAEWDARTLTSGTAGPPSPVWGDYLRARPFSGASNSWIATGYTIQSGVVEPRFYVFGRQGDNPVLPAISFRLGGVTRQAQAPILRIDGVDYTYAQFPLTLSWLAGSSHMVEASPLVGGGPGTRFLWSSWTNGGSLSAASGTYITPTASQILTVNYVTQYQLQTTFPEGSSVTVSPSVGDSWFAARTRVTITASHVWNVQANQSRSNLASYMLDGSTTSIERSGAGAFTLDVLMDRPHTLILRAVTQFFLVIEGGRDITTVPQSPTGDGWHDAGTTMAVRTAYVWDEARGQSRESLIAWTLDDGPNQPVARSGSGVFTTPEIIMDAPHRISLRAVTQFALTLSGGSGIGYSTPSQTGDNWFDAGTTTQVQSLNVWGEVVDQSRQNLLMYNLDGTTTRPPRAAAGADGPTLTFDRPHSLAFGSVTQYYLKVIGGHNIAFDPLSPTADQWYDADQLTAVISDHVWDVTQDRARQQLVGWQFDTDETTSVARTESGTFRTPLLRMDEAHQVTFHNIAQFFVSVLTPLGEAKGQGWYDTGTVANFSVSPTQIGSGLTLPVRIPFPVGLPYPLAIQVFDSWTGDSLAREASAAILVDEPKNVIATWRTDPTHLFLLVGVAAGLAVITKRSRDLARSKRRTH